VGGRYSAIVMIMKRNTTFHIFLIVAFFSISAAYFYPAHFLDAKELRHFIREDGFMEMSGALFFLAGSLVMFSVYIHSRSFTSFNFNASSYKRNIFFLLLAIFMFLCFGEEISWGQRLFEIGTPKALKGINVQRELNIHNITIFHAGHKDYLIGHHALIRNFIYIYCVALPMLDRWIPLVSKMRCRIGLPLTSLSVALLFLSNEAFNIIASLSYPSKHGDLYEVYESIWGFLFFIFSADQWVKLENRK